VGWQAFRCRCCGITSAPRPSPSRPERRFRCSSSCPPQQTKLEFHWQPGVAGQFHRLEVFDAKQQLVLSAIVRADGGSYVAPSWFVERVTAPQILRWRVAALDAQGAVRGSSGYRLIHYGLNP
jgi:hypothetical protein